MGAKGSKVRRWGLSGRAYILVLIAALLTGLAACGPLSRNAGPQDSGLVVAGTRLSRSEDGKTLLLEGKVNNYSDKEVPFVQLRARLYDSLGNLIRTGAGNPEPAKIKAGEGSSFRIKVPYDPAIAEFRVDIVNLPKRPQAK